MHVWCTLKVYVHDVDWITYLHEGWACFLVSYGYTSIPVTYFTFSSERN